MGVQIFLVEIVNAIVVIFMWKNSMGRTGKLSHVQWAGVMTYAWCYNFRAPEARRDIPSSRVTSYISEITEFYPFVLVWSPVTQFDWCSSSCETSRLAAEASRTGVPTTSLAACCNGNSPLLLKMLSLFLICNYLPLASSWLCFFPNELFSN